MSALGANKKYKRQLEAEAPARSTTLKRHLKAPALSTNMEALLWEGKVLQEEDIEHKIDKAETIESTR